MRLIARVTAGSAAVALIALAGAAAALAQELPSDADTPTDSPSAWDGVWPWLLVAVGVFAFLGLLAFGLSWQRRRAPARAPAAGPRASAAPGRSHARTRDLAGLARRNGLDTLAYLLDIARLEAESAEKSAGPPSDVA